MIENRIMYAASKFIPFWLTDSNIVAGPEWTGERIISVLNAYSLLISFLCLIQASRAYYRYTLTPVRVSLVQLPENI